MLRTQLFLVDTLAENPAAQLAGQDPFVNVMSVIACLDSALTIDNDVQLGQQAAVVARWQKRQAGDTHGHSGNEMPARASHRCGLRLLWGALPRQA